MRNLKKPAARSPSKHLVLADIPYSGFYKIAEDVLGLIDIRPKGNFASGGTYGSTTETLTIPTVTSSDDHIVIKSDSSNQKSTDLLTVDELIKIWNDDSVPAILSSIPFAVAMKTKSTLVPTHVTKVTASRLIHTKPKARIVLELNTGKHIDLTYDHGKLIWRDFATDGDTKMGGGNFFGKATQFVVALVQSVFQSKLAKAEHEAQKTIDQMGFTTWMLDIPEVSIFVNTCRVVMKYAIYFEKYCIDSRPCDHSYSEIVTRENIDGKELNKNQKEFVYLLQRSASYFESNGIKSLTSDELNALQNAWVQIASSTYKYHVKVYNHNNAFLNFDFKLPNDSEMRLRSESNTPEHVTYYTKQKDSRGIEEPEYRFLLSNISSFGGLNNSANFLHTALLEPASSITMAFESFIIYHNSVESFSEELMIFYSKNSVLQSLNRIKELFKNLTPTFIISPENYITKNNINEYIKIEPADDITVFDNIKHYYENHNIPVFDAVLYLFPTNTIGFRKRFDIKSKDIPIWMYHLHERNFFEYSDKLNTLYSVSLNHLNIHDDTVMNTYYHQYLHTLSNACKRIFEPDKLNDYADKIMLEAHDERENRLKIAVCFSSLEKAKSILKSLFPQLKSVSDTQVIDVVTDPHLRLSKILINQETYALVESLFDTLDQNPYLDVPRINKSIDSKDPYTTLAKSLALYSDRVSEFNSDSAIEPLKNLIDEINNSSFGDVVKSKTHPFHKPLQNEVDTLFPKDRTNYRFPWIALSDNDAIKNLYKHDYDKTVQIATDILTSWSSDLFSTEKYDKEIREFIFKKLESKYDANIKGTADKYVLRDDTRKYVYNKLYDEDSFGPCEFAGGEWCMGENKPLYYFGTLVEGSERNTFGKPMCICGGHVLYLMNKIVSETKESIKANNNETIHKYLSELNYLYPGIRDYNKLSLSEIQLAFYHSTHRNFPFPIHTIEDKPDEIPYPQPLMTVLGDPKTITRDSITNIIDAYNKSLESSPASDSTLGGSKHTRLTCSSIATLVALTVAASFIS